jgi:Flp pilus assembly protein TadG
MKSRLRIRAAGATLVEFAIVVVLLLTLVFGLLELGRALWTWNSAVDAVRRGARTAAIMEIGDEAAVLAQMQLVFPALEAGSVTIQYSPDGHFPGAACVRGTCRFVNVGITGYAFHTVIFFLPDTIAMPGFSATYPVEALGAR